MSHFFSWNTRKILKNHLFSSWQVTVTVWWWQWYRQGQELWLMVLQHTGFRCRDIVTLSKTVKVGESNCPAQSSPNQLGVKRILRSLLCTTLLCVSVRLFLCMWQTVSLDSQGNHKPQQTLRAESSIWNPIVRDQEDNSSTGLMASSRCWLGPWGTREKMKNWWVKYDLYLIYCTPVLSSNLCGWVISW